MRSPQQNSRRHFLRVVSNATERSGASGTAGDKDEGTPTEVSPRSVLRVRVELSGTQVPVWREVFLPARLTLEEVHVVVQVCFEWDDSQLHEFQAGQARYLDARDDALLDAPEMQTDNQVRLHQIVNGFPFELSYLYSQDEYWLHRLTVLEALPPDPNMLYPLCIAGENASPPEGVGGAHGYNDFLSCLGRVKTPDGLEALQWIGGHWDASAFSSNAVNRSLHADRRLLMMSNTRERLDQYWDPE